MKRLNIFIRKRQGYQPKKGCHGQLEIKRLIRERNRAFEWKTNVIFLQDKPLRRYLM